MSEAAHGTMTAREVRKQLTALYRNLSISPLYTALKLSILPIHEAAEYLPAQGKILDVGCGYGYLANYLSLDRPERHVVGHDVAPDRIDIARRTVGNRRNVEFVVADSRQLPEAFFDGIVVADVLHHIPYEEQAAVLADLFSKLKPGGRLVLRETDKRFSLRFFIFNYGLEWVLYSRSEKLRFRPAADWTHILESVGYQVLNVIPNPPLFPYITATFICAKPTASSGERRPP